MTRLTPLEELQQETADEEIRLSVNALPARLKGLYYASNDGIPPVIALNSSIKTEAEKTCVLAEELGHYHTSNGDLLTTGSNKLLITKQEGQARRWATKKLVPLKGIIQAFEYGARNRYEFAEYLGVTESFLDESIDYYKKIYGLLASVDEIYTIYFEPFGIFKNLE